MKFLSTSFLILIALFFFSSHCDAKIWRVNNNANIKADFVDAQSAVNGASAGDTIHLEPSASDYGSVNLTKKLFLIGVGHSLDVNSGNQVSPNPAKILDLSVTSSAANGSTLMIYIDGETTLSNVSNVSLKRCFVAKSVQLTNCNNVILTGMFINKFGTSGSSIFLKNSKNIVITNNIISGRVDMDGEGSSALIVNNVLNSNASSGTIAKVYNSVFQNNIIANYSPINFSASVTIQNNIASSTSFPSTSNSSNNQNGVDMSKVFVNYRGSVDTAFQVQPSSITIGAGVNGVDCGAFGGATPYVLAGQPPIPAIYKLTVPATVAGNTLHIEFSTKSNN